MFIFPAEQNESLASKTSPDALITGNIAPGDKPLTPWENVFAAWVRVYDRLMK